MFFQSCFGLLSSSFSFFCLSFYAIFSLFMLISYSNYIFLINKSFHLFTFFLLTIFHSPQPPVLMLYKLILSMQAYWTKYQFIYLWLKLFINLLCLDSMMISPIYLCLIIPPKLMNVMLNLKLQIILNFLVKLNAHVRDVHFLPQGPLFYFITLKFSLFSSRLPLLRLVTLHFAIFHQQLAHSFQPYQYSF